MEIPYSNLSILYVENRNMSTKRTKNEQDHVIVEVGPCSQCSVQVKRVHHRDFPEVRAECGSVDDAAAHLAQMLATHREGAGSGWHRESINRAIDEVNAFRDSLFGHGDDTAGSCCCGIRAALGADASVSSQAPPA